MSYDEALADRIRNLVSSQAGISEKQMFGGIAFLIYGNMAIAASGQGGILVRVDPKQTEELLANTEATMMEMRGVSMPGWLRLTSKDVQDDEELTRWVKLGVEYALTLLPKE